MRAKEESFKKDLINEFKKNEQSQEEKIGSKLRTEIQKELAPKIRHEVMKEAEAELVSKEIELKK